MFVKLLNLLRILKNAFMPAADVLFFPLTVLGGLWLKQIRRWGIHKLPLSRKILAAIGVFPLNKHYHEPLFDFKHIDKDSNIEPRDLPGIDLNLNSQIAFIKSLNFGEELKQYPLLDPGKEGMFYYRNNFFESGDAEIYYSIVRKFKPKRVIEIGSGFSTLMLLNAISANKKEDSNYNCLVKCIEPYERDWLEKTGFEIVREKVENICIDGFNELEENDILFIDSSHVIKPFGDVILEILEVLPRLKKGVLIHIHDIYTPMEYPKEWMTGNIRFWNEQYILEAFLSQNNNFEITAALAYLFAKHRKILIDTCPNLKKDLNEDIDSDPASFWIRKII